MDQISSRSNALIAHVRKLIADKSYRRQSGEMVCEGPKMLEEALRNGAQLTLLLQTEDAQIPACLPIELRRVCVPQELLNWVADTQTPQKLLFLCRLPDITPPHVLIKGNYLVLDGIQDPGNVGTIWRTADAFGAEGLLLVSSCADPFGPKTLRASMGACFRLPVWELDLPHLKQLLQQTEIPLYATALREDALLLNSVSLQQSVVVIGSEGSGVSEGVLALCEKTLMIPMRPRCESLNAAVAASVVLWEMARAEPDAT